MSYFGTQLSDLFNDIKESAQQRQDANTQSITKQRTDTICDPKIIIYLHVVT